MQDQQQRPRRQGELDRIILDAPFGEGYFTLLESIAEEYPARNQQSEHEDKEEYRCDQVENRLGAGRQLGIDDVYPHMTAFTQHETAGDQVLHAEHQKHGFVRPVGRRIEHVA